MFGIGSMEFLVIIIVAILVLGPDHLPKVLRTMQKVMSDFRKVSTDFQRAMNLDAMEEDVKRHGKETNKQTIAPKSEPLLADEMAAASPEPLQHSDTSPVPGNNPNSPANDALSQLIQEQQNQAVHTTKLQPLSPEVQTSLPEQSPDIAPNQADTKSDAGR